MVADMTSLPQPNSSQQSDRYAWLHPFGWNGRFEGLERQGMLSIGEARLNVSDVFFPCRSINERQ